MTPINVPLIYTITIISSRKPQADLHQDLNITKNTLDHKISSYYITVFLQLM